MIHPLKIEMLTIQDFAGYFEEVHGNPPFPWQTRLLRTVVEEGWPTSLDLPTGFGKTAALDIAVFHLALEAARGTARRAAARIVFVVDRRLVVDDAFGRAEKISTKLQEGSPGSKTHLVAQQLLALAGNGAPPLIARQMRGGMPLESDWAKSPAQPTILCSTVDQAGSRLLFRGYGVTNSMKPVHAGLLGSDCLLLLDEAHLSEPFRQTLSQIAIYKSKEWRRSEYAAPWHFVTLTATPGSEDGTAFGPEHVDLQNEVLARRWNASKLAILADVAKTQLGPQNPLDEAASDEEPDPDHATERMRVACLVQQAEKALNKLKGMNPAIAIVVNRVHRARAVFETINKLESFQRAERLLMIGAARPIDRDDLARKLEPIRTGGRNRPAQPLLIVSTQCIEAGVDIDLDGLITEAAPIDALRQRFGRLNRDGRPIDAYAAIAGGKADKKDSVYGAKTLATWQYLSSTPDHAEVKKPFSPPKIDFGLKAFAVRLERDLQAVLELHAEKNDAPILMPAHVDLLSQTSPVPLSDPEVALYLHGPNRSADAITVIWRADIEQSIPPAKMCALLRLTRPRSLEAIELPVWVVQAWLRRDRAATQALADIPVEPPDDDETGDDKASQVFQWTGEDDTSAWVKPGSIRPGDTLIVPAFYGGVDSFGWYPGEPRCAAEETSDVADAAAQRYASRYLAIRVAPAWFVGAAAKQQVSEIIISTARWQDLRDALKAMVRKEIASLTTAVGAARAIARGRRAKMLEEIVWGLEALDGRVEQETEPYEDDEGTPRGVVFVAPRGIKSVIPHASGAEDSPNTTEDDLLGSHADDATGLSIERHCRDVENKVRQFAQGAGIQGERVTDLCIAASLHDAGKLDERFQQWLHYEDPLGFDEGDTTNLWAKSPRRLPPVARTRSGLPPHWRHEALSVRLAQHAAPFAEANDQELVLWLIGTHHGHGKPFFPHYDPEDGRPRDAVPEILGLVKTLAAGPGPQSMAFDWSGFDWPSLYRELKRRYGVWELARMEACLRLADHAASDAAVRSTQS